MKRLVLFFLAIFIASVYALAQPANNNLANALELTQRNNWCSSLAGYSNVGATLDGSSSACGNANNNVWFKFQAVTSYIKLDVKTGGSEGNINSPEIALWNSTNTEVICANSTGSSGDVNIVTGDLIVGQWYYASVYTSSSGSGNQGTFTLCANDQPTFDYRAGAVELAQKNNWCSALATYTSTGSTNDGASSSCGSPNNNVWFKFQAATTYIKLDVKTGGSEGNISAPEIALWSSTNTEIMCGNSTGSSGDVSIVTGDLTVGQWYYASVYTNSSSSGNQGTFTLCANDQPSFDYKAGALELTQLNNWCSALATYTNVGATADGSSASGGCGAPNNNVWFKFQSTTGYIKFDVKSGGSEGTISSQKIVLWSSTNNQVMCANAGFSGNDLSLETGTLTSGEWYYVSVDGNPGTFTLCANDQPSFDYKAGALELTQLNNWCSALATYTNVGATADGSSASGGCGAPNNNVWFKFQSTTGYIKFDVKSGGSEGTISSQKIVLWSSTNNQVMCANAGFSGGDLSIETGALTSGEWYYVSVDGNPGTFSLCANDQPTFNYRQGALELTQRNNWCSGLAAYNNNNATADGPVSTCGDPNYNVWFKFQATTPYIKLDLKTGSLEGTIQYQGITLWNSSNQEIICANDGSGLQKDISIEKLDLTVGQWYYVSIYVSNSTNSNPGTFTLCANDQPSFNLQVGAIELTQKDHWCSGLAAYNNIDATPDGPTSSCGSPANNVWFKFQAATPYIKFDVKTGGAEGTIPGPEIVLWNSNNTEVTCENSQASWAGSSIERFDLTVGQWYYFSIHTANQSPSAQGTFTICVNDQASFDYKVGAIELTQKADWCSALSAYTNIDATPDGPTSGCGNPNSNVWFKFQASTSYLKAFAKTGGEEGTISMPRLTLWNNNSEVACVSGVESLSDVSIEKTDLVIGQWYYLSVDTESSSSAAQGTFSLCIYDNPICINPLIVSPAEISKPCLGLTNGAITLTGSETDLSYALGNGQQKAGTGSALVWDNLNAGSYTLTIQRSTCQPVIMNIDVEALLITAKVVSEGLPVFCDGSSVSLLSFFETGYSFQWRKDNVNIAEATTPYYHATEQGSYSVSITKDGCNEISNAVDVTKASKPLATITPAGATTFCKGSSVILNGSTGANYTFQWRSDELGEIKGETSSSYTVFQSGAYKLITKIGSCSTESLPQIVVVNPIPEISVVSSGPSAVCQGNTITLAAIGEADSYQWKRGNSVITGETTTSYVVGEANSFKVAATLGPCSAESNVIATIVKPIPAPVTSLTGPATIPAGDKLVYSVTGAASNDVYLWNTPAGTNITYGDPKRTSATIGFNELGERIITVTAQKQGCESTPVEKTIEVIEAVTSIPSQIPAELKVTPARQTSLPLLSNSLGLNTFNQDDVKQVFETCAGGEYYLAFQLYYDALADFNTVPNWTALVDVTLMQGPSTILWTRSMQVDMASQTFISTIFHDTPITCTGDYRLKIKTKSTNINGIQAPEQNIYLKVLLYKRMTDTFDPSTQVSSLDYNVINEKVEIAWSYPGNAVKGYDLEWVLMEDHENFTGTALEAFLAKEPIRVTTGPTDFSYKHHNFYPKGKMWFRVRAIGYNPLYPQHNILSSWYYGTGIGLDVTNPQADKNWQMQTVFAEEGKYKKIVTYYDGTLRQRQAQTNLSTEDQTLVGETLYDFEGRKSIDILPVPTVAPSLTYKSNFNAFQAATDPTVAANTSAIQKKFNYDNQQLVNTVLAQTSGAGRYYSEANTVGSITQGPKGYVPDADGYAYSQTEYMNDGTGRAVRQSGVGEAFRMDGGHTTRYYYAEASKVELVRLFGPNVGNPSHYKKNVVVDPNGQVSVSYVDQAGQVIATALAGEPPSTVDPLPSYQALSTGNITVNLSSKNVKENDRSQTTHKFLNEAINTEYSFNYNLSGIGAGVTDFGCFSCTYDLTITITDPDGKLLALGSIAGNESGDATSYVRKGLTAGCSGVSPLSNVHIELVLVDIGEYTITKTLTAHELSFDQLKTIVGNDAEVQQTIQLINNNYVVNPVDCAICTSCPEAENFIDEAIDEVADLDCDNILQEIIQKLKKANGSPDFEPTEEAIQLDPLYCKYELCMKDKASDIFEKKLARVERWSVATEPDGPYKYQTLATVNNSVDPFFAEEELTGYSFKNSMQSKLSSVGIKGTPFGGSILQVTDPDNTAYYINDVGEVDPYGYHVLYYDLMSKRPQLGETAYLEQLDKQRWTLFRGLYLEAKRQLKLTIPAYTTLCTEAYNALKVNDEVPQATADIPATNTSITNWGKNNGVEVEVSDEELEMHIASLNLKCDIKISAPHIASITTYLRNYFNSNKKNFLRLILQPDLGVNANLVAVQNILTGYNCSLDSIAEPDPSVCLQTFTPTVYNYGPNLIANPSFNGCSTNAEITASCSGWKPAYGSPYLMSDNAFQLEATNCGQDALMGYFSTPLVPGKKYRLKFKYKMSVGSQAGDSFVELSQSELIETGPAAFAASSPQGRVVVPMIEIRCDSMPHSVNPDPVTFLNGAGGSTRLWSYYNAPTSYTNVEVTFIPTAASTYIFFFHRMNAIRQGTMDAIFKDVEVREVTESTLPPICLKYKPIDTWVFEPDWAGLVDKCNEQAELERLDLIGFAKDLYLEEQATLLNNAYRTSCITAAMEQLDYVYNPKEYHYTLYYYDQANNLVQTVPPEGVHPLNITEANSATPSYPPHTLLTQYQYTSVNQLSWQSTPDAGISEFLYNKKGQLRLSHNAQQTLDNKYSYTKYDPHGRITEVGELTAAVPASTITQYVDDPRFPTTGVAELPTYPTADVTRTYYDNVNETIVPKLLQQNVRNRVSWIEVTDKNSSNKSLSYYSYDIHGNVKSLLQQMPGLEEKRTDYAYDLVSGKVNYVFYQFGKTDQFIHKYSYDADNRVKTASTSSDAYLWYLEASYKYYAHGPLARTEVGEYRVQGQDYYYTLQGWIKGVNMPFDGDPGSDGVGTSKVGKDVYAYTLGYYQGDYKASNASAILSDTRDQQWARYNTLMGNTGLYNGNISWMTTDLAKIGEVNNNRSKGMQAMLYRYDQLHRIKKSQSLSTYAQGSGFATRTATPAAYDENYAYDGNGNITTLNRYSATATLADDFTYDYYANTNKLRKVKAADGDYVYDAIGNLVNDNVNNVSISWTPYGKVREVHKNGNAEIVSYLYDAAGNRVSKTVAIPGTTTITHYVRDASGNTMGVYTNTVVAEQPVYASSRVGQYKGGVLEGTLVLGKRNYELSNHLGNVLAVITDNVSFQGVDVFAKVINTSDYYPFGLEMNQRTYTDATAYRYGFNGKEKDNFGDAVYDYGFRIYDPRIAKFLSVDPLTESYPWYTPYQYAGNKPIVFVDLDGLEEAYKLPGSDYIIPASDQIRHQPPPKAQYLYRASKEKMDASNEASKDAASLFPGAGDVIDFYDVINESKQGNYLQAGLSLVSLVPIADFVTKPLKFALKSSDEVAAVVKKTTKLNPCGCFDPGTPVLTDSGFVSIEKIKVGSYVWAYNEKTAQRELKKVLRTINYRRDTLYSIKVGSEIIKATSDHPFFINAKWVSVKKIKVGDYVELYSGKKDYVENISFIVGEFIVYNFTVDELHNYYVSNQRILVHNGGPCEFAKVSSIKKWEIKMGDKSTLKIDDIKKQISEKGIGSLPAVEVYIHNGETLLVDGHHRLAAAIEMGIESIPVKYLNRQEFNATVKRMFPNGAGQQFSTPEGLKSIADRLSDKQNVVR